MKNNKTAVVIGATGATGRHVVRLLLDHPQYQKVIVLARRTTGLLDEKLVEHEVDFAKPHQWQDLVQGDELFSALGTTLKQAGSKEGQYQVDVSYQLNVAKAARANTVDKLILVSSPNANSKASNFYLRMKGELDDAVRALEFSHCFLIKPSIIISDRPEGRPGERIAASVLNSIWRWVPGLGRFRPITGERLARSMVAIANADITLRQQEFQLDELFNFDVKN